MQDTKMVDLYNQFMKLMESGSEAEARKFLTDNFNAFPESVQEELTLAFFEEAVQKEADSIKAIVDIQKTGIDAMSQLEKAKQALEDAAKAEEIKQSM